MICILILLVLLSWMGTAIKYVGYIKSDVDILMNIARREVVTKLVLKNYSLSDLKDLNIDELIEKAYK